MNNVEEYSSVQMEWDAIFHKKAVLSKELKQVETEICRLAKRMRTLNEECLKGVR